MNYCAHALSKKGAMLEGLGNSLVLSIIQPKTTRSISCGDGSEVELILPDFGMYAVEQKEAEDQAQIESWAKEYDHDDTHEAYMDARDSFEIRHAKTYTGYLLGLVIGENPSAKLPEYGTRDAHLPMDQRTPVRWSSPYEMPEFGDVVLFRQSVATDYAAFWKLPCDTTPACEFLLCSRDQRRWIRVPRSAEVVTVPISELWNTVRKFGAPAVAQPIPA